MTTAPHHDSVVFALAYQTWADAVEQDMSWSADRMMQHLCADPQVRQVVIADPLRSHASKLRHSRADKERCFPASSTRHLVHPYRVRRHDASSVGASVRAYGRLARWLARRAMALGVDEPVLVTSHPVLAAVAKAEGWSDVVYYGWDDWESYPPFAHVDELIRWSYTRMAVQDVSVIGVTGAIVERIGSPRGVVIPNGIRAADFDDLPPVPSWFAETPGPVAYYAGSLEGRVDVTALLGLAEDLPDWTIVLVGFPNDLSHFEALRKHPNVVLRGPEPRPVALAMMAAADVCLVPHRETPMTVAMSPLKLYEYLGAGAPVVATDLPPLRGISDRCLLVPPGDSMTSAVLEAAARPRAGAEEIRRFREDHDWSQRYRQWRSVVLGA